MLFYIILLYLLIEIFTQLLEADDDGKVYKAFSLLVGAVVATGEVLFLDAHVILFLFVPICSLINIFRRVLFSLTKLEEANLFKLILTIGNIILNIYLLVLLEGFISNYLTLTTRSDLASISPQVYVLLAVILSFEVLQRYFEKGTDLLNIEFESYGPLVATVFLFIFGALLALFSYTKGLEINLLLSLFIGYTIFIMILTLLTSTVFDDYEDDFNVTYLFPVLFGLIIISSLFFS